MQQNLRRKLNPIDKRSNPDAWAREQLCQIRYRAKDRGWDFDLTLSDLVLPPVCMCCGVTLTLVPMTFDKGPRSPYAPSIDRLDSSKGYTKDNIRIICARDNHLKNNGTVEEFEKIIAYMKRESGK